MVYLSNGQVFEGRPWSISAIVAAFWGLINFIVLFFKTLINPNISKGGPSYTTDYRHNGRPGEHGRRIGRVRGPGGSPSAPPMGGGG